MRARTVASDIDRAWEAVRDASRPRIHMVIATSDLHIEHKLQTTRQDVLGQARAAVAHAKQYVDDVEFSCEDGFRSDREFMAEVISATIAEGATTINVADTVGYARATARAADFRAAGAIAVRRCEETLQDGIRGFIKRHRHELDPRKTWMLNMDTIGSPRLIMTEGEGPFWMQDYADPAFRDLIEQCANELGIRLERGFRARSSTDSVITSRAGYPSTCLGSLNDWQMMANYHLLSDVPENLDYGTIADATRLAYAVARALGS